VKLVSHLSISSERKLRQSKCAVSLILDYYQTEPIDESQRGISDWPTDDVDEYVEE